MYMRNCQEKKGIEKMVRIIPLTKEIIGKYMGQLIKIDLECMPEKREEYSREVILI